MPRQITDDRMLAAALRWNTGEVKAIILERMQKIVATGKERAAISAAKALISCEQQNQADELKLIPETHLNANLNVDAGRTEAAEVLERIRAIRANALGPVSGTPAGGNGHASGPGHNGIEGTVEAGPTPEPDKPSGNGRHKRNGATGSDS